MADRIRVPPKKPTPAKRKNQRPVGRRSFEEEFFDLVVEILGRKGRK